MHWGKDSPFHRRNKFRFQGFGYYWAGSLHTTVRYHELFDLIKKKAFLTESEERH